MSVLCEHCNKQYSSQWNLTRHLKSCKSTVEVVTFTPPLQTAKPGVTDYECTYCSKRYKTKGSLDRHLKSCGGVPTSTEVLQSDNVICTLPVAVTLKLNESSVEIRFLKEQLKKQEDRSKEQEDSLKEQLKQQEERSRKQMKALFTLSKEQIDRLNDQIFKLASRATTTNITQP